MEVVSLTLFRIFFALNSPPSYLHEFLPQRDTEKWLFYVYSTLFCTSSCSSQSASQVLHRVSWIELTETNNNSTCWEEPKEEMRKGVAGGRNKTGENESSRSRYKRILKTWSTATVTKEQLNILWPARDKFREFVVNCCLFSAFPRKKPPFYSLSPSLVCLSLLLPVLPARSSRPLYCSSSTAILSSSMEVVKKFVMQLNYVEIVSTGTSSALPSFLLSTQSAANHEAARRGGKKR